MMKLSEFVRDALNEIADGIINATEDLATKTNNHPIAPGKILGRENDTSSFIDFEVSTIVKDVESESGDIKGQIWVVGIGNEAETIKESQNITKIKFSVPIVFGALKKPK